MRRMMTLTVCTLIGCLAGPLSAEPPAKAPAAAKAPGPCEQIAEACKSAGFIAGDYKTGNGLWVDCVDPIMRGTGQPSKAKIPLPQVSPEVVAACKAKRPNFGEPKGPPAKGAQGNQPSGK
jgi:hypothetical protein